MQPDAIPELSIVVCVFNEEESIVPFLTQVEEVLGDLCLDGHEIVFVDDGSDDRTWEVIADLAHQRDDIVGIHLRQNAGKENALVAGLAAARGRAHLPMDVDLQDPPSLIPNLLQPWREGAESVLARRESRDDSWFRRLAGHLLYRVLEPGSEVAIPRDIGDFRLLDQRTTERFLKLAERSRFNKGLFALVEPVDSVHIEYRRPRGRSSGSDKPRQSFTKLVALTVSGITSFTTWPLQLMSGLGFLLLGLSVCVGVTAVILRVLGILEVPGQTTVVLLFAFLFGFQALSTGVLGVYIGQILKEVKMRPLYQVEDCVGIDTELQVRVEEVAHQQR